MAGHCRGPLGKGRRCEYVGATTGVPRIAADLLNRPSRQGRAIAPQKNGR